MRIYELSFNPLTFKLALETELHFTAFLSTEKIHTIVLLVMMVVG